MYEPNGVWDTILLKNKLRNIKILRSLKSRIFLILLIVGLIPCVSMRYAILQNYEQRAVNVKISDVSTQLRILANHLITYHYLQDTSSEVINAELDQLSSLYDGRVLVINNDLKVVKDTYGISENKTIISEEVVRCIKGENTSRYDRNNGYVEMTIPITETVTLGGNEKEAKERKEIVRGVMLVSASTDSISVTMEILSRKALIVEVIVIIVTTIVSVLAAKILIRPFEKITEALDEAQEGYSSDPISVTDCVETEHIGDAFNRVLGRMKVLDTSRQEFVSNVSHELRTPITSMKVLADSLISQKDVPVELYQEFMEDIAEEIDREDEIITDLLSLVKMDRTAADLNITEVDINALVELIMRRLRPIAQNRDVEVVYESVRPVTAAVDEVKITQVISNLVENAIKYNKEHGWVRVKLDADHQYFSVEVADSGIGIPAESIDHIYERFYRVDKSRSREIGGTGLGLAITRSAILMHRGTIKVESIEGEGTTFTIRIPLKYIPV
ncbi:MAG: cell wall metabolism sensor histidine kinase WalK [Lachnospiraceae bacterium]|nr:cell wall metabolism sensor histidine kinase WalK [Lachnospiraceae bacterium]MCI9014222.1 cell wall metabolism sensor histidine kinase WalK [Lachnospiraceae bacterium]